MKMLMSSFSDLSILLFPCGQYGDQELQTVVEIKDFVKSKGLDNKNVHIMKKCDVMGPNADPVFRFFKEQTGADDPQWNFKGKFLVSRDGVVSVPGGNIKGDIQKLVDQ